ncbi:tandem-95 repeat protein [Chitinimonas koreensis]|uniref:tandem-95 repeat protein n=1 Tax=Chitinimonas koreensis TaxID=356302 RepID=UPI001654304E|nr:tandem-95 repeat protein [Chitinimonas koreensis]QNM95070.1 tandem-95 repeat protein [Chitinimonas koreensis]
MRALNGNDAGTPYGYGQDGRLLTDTITANLGAAVNWQSNSAWQGTLAAGQATTVAFAVRESELASTVKTPGAQGAVIVAVTLEGADLALEATGATVLGTATVDGKRTVLLRITEAGLKLLRLTGSGAARVEVTLAGDLNRDGKIDGQDGAAFEQARLEGRLPADLDGDGVIASADRQILYANYGWRANQAPVELAAGTARTHADLALQAALAGIAQDLEGDTVFWRVLGATHGAARLSADGQSVIFVPEAGYVGEAAVRLQADDGFAAGAPIELKVNVSGARLLAIHLAQLPALKPGQTAQVRATVDFEDQQGVDVSHDPAYLTLYSADLSALGKVGGDSLQVIDGQDALKVLTRGPALLVATRTDRDGRVVQAVQTVNPGFDAAGNTKLLVVPDVYPGTLALTPGGSRQLKVHLVDPDTGAKTDISQARPSVASGTRYFSSDASIATVSEGGLITAIGAGSALITVVHLASWLDPQGNLVEQVVGQATVRLEIGAAQSVDDDPATATPAGVTVSREHGGAVQAATGETVLIGAGALAADTVVGIGRIELGQIEAQTGLALPTPDVLQPVAAFHLDLGAQPSEVPVQLAIPLQTSAEVKNGDEVLFLRRGTVPDVNGVERDTWWVLDNGFVGTDAQGNLVAKTASPPYAGVNVFGDYVVVRRTSTDKDTGAVTAKGMGLDLLALSMGPLTWAAGAMMGSGSLAAASAMTSVMSIYLSAAIPIYAINLSFDGAYQVKPVQTNIVNGNITLSIESPDNPGSGTSSDRTSPQIGKIEMTTGGKLKLELSNLKDPALPAGTPTKLRFWISPDSLEIDKNGRATSDIWDGKTTERHGMAAWQQLVDVTVSGDSQTVELDVPADIALSLHLITVQRMVQLPDPKSPAVKRWITNGAAGSVAMEGQTGYSVVTQAKWVQIFKNGEIVKELEFRDAEGNSVFVGGSKGDQIAFSEDQRLMFIAGMQGDIHVVDTALMKLVYTLKVGTCNISSLAVADGWLYVGEGGYGGAGADYRLLRVNLDETDKNFMQIQQVKLPPSVSGENAPAGYVDFAVVQGEHSYLAVTASKLNLGISMAFPPRVSGNVFILDLDEIVVVKGQADATSAKAFKQVSFTDPTHGRGPQFISSAGIVGGQLRLLLTDAFDYNSGLSTVTIAIGEDGALNGAPVVRKIAMSGVLPGASSVSRYNNKYQLNLQRAQSPSLVISKDGVEYAVVADYYFEFNDPNYLMGVIANKQTGGKIGIIKDPFGPKPEYLGATTPILDASINRLQVIDGGRTLWADIRYWPGIGEPALPNGMLKWDLRQLIEAAEANSIVKQNSMVPLPIDRVGKPGSNTQTVVPDKYNLADSAKATSGWLFGMATVEARNVIELDDQKFGDVVEVDLRKLLQENGIVIDESDPAFYMTKAVKEIELDDGSRAIGAQPIKREVADFGGFKGGQVLSFKYGDEWEMVQSGSSKDEVGAKTFADSGKFYLTADLDDNPLSRGSDLPARTVTGTIFVHAKSIKGKAVVGNSVAITVKINFKKAVFNDQTALGSGTGGNSGMNLIALSEGGSVGKDQANKPLDVARIQQRLKFLGYPSISATMPLEQGKPLEKDALGRPIGTPTRIIVDGRWDAEDVTWQQIDGVPRAVHPSKPGGQPGSKSPDDPVTVERTEGALRLFQAAVGLPNDDRNSPWSKPVDNNVDGTTPASDIAWFAGLTSEGLRALQAQNEAKKARGEPIPEAVLRKAEMQMAAGNRVGAYITLFKETGNELLAVQMQIASYSGGFGGGAILGNSMAKADAMTDMYDVNLDQFSADIDSGNIRAMRADIRNGGTGRLTVDQLAAVDRGVWAMKGLGQEFPGNMLFGPQNPVPGSGPYGADSDQFWDKLAALVSNGNLNSTLIGAHLFYMEVGIRPSEYRPGGTYYNADPAKRYKIEEGDRFIIVTNPANSSVVSVFDKQARILTAPSNAVKDFVGLVAGFLDFRRTQVSTALPTNEELKHMFQDLSGFDRLITAANTTGHEVVGAALALFRYTLTGSAYDQLLELGNKFKDLYNDEIVTRYGGTKYADFNPSAEGADASVIVWARRALEIWVGANYRLSPGAYPNQPGTQAPGSNPNYDTLYNAYVTNAYDPLKQLQAEKAKENPAPPLKISAGSDSLLKWLNTANVPRWVEVKAGEKLTVANVDTNAERFGTSWAKQIVDEAAKASFSLLQQLGGQKLEVAAISENGWTRAHFDHKDGLEVDISIANNGHIAPAYADDADVPKSPLELSLDSALNGGKTAGRIIREQWILDDLAPELRGARSYVGGVNNGLFTDLSAGAVQAMLAKVMESSLTNGEKALVVNLVNLRVQAAKEAYANPKNGRPDPARDRWLGGYLGEDIAGRRQDLVYAVLGYFNIHDLTPSKGYFDRAGIKLKPVALDKLTEKYETLDVQPADTGATAGQPAAGTAAPVDEPLDLLVLRAAFGSAITRWQAADLSAAQREALGKIELAVADLDGQALARLSQGRIEVDADAAGHGWFVDATPEADEEFLATRHGSEMAAREDSAAYDHVDLVSVLMHEIGHALGLEHADEGHALLSASMGVGMRRLPDGEWLTPSAAAPSAAAGNATVSIGLGSVQAGMPAGMRWDTLANPTLENGGFGSAAGWNVEGGVAFANGRAVLGETAVSQTRLGQVFQLGTQDRYLSFTVSDLALDDQAGPDDAFEAALLDAATGASLAGSLGLSRSDALLNIQADGRQRLGQGVTVTVNADGSRTYLVDLQGIAAGTAVNLSFDLIGFGRDAASLGSHATVRDVRLIGLPETRDDAAVTAEDQAAAIEVRGNDIGAQIAGFAPELVAGPAHGSVVLNADGTFRYLPAQDWSGEDSFSYRLSNGTAASNVSTVRITVTPVNDAPVLQGFAAATPEDTAVLLDLLARAGDVDSDAATLQLELVAAPAHGSLVLEADGRYRYTPAADYHGADAFSYRVGDGELWSETVTVDLTVTPVNDAPIAQDAALQTAEDQALQGRLPAGQDVDGDTLSAVLVAGPAHGSVVLNADGSFRYVPAADFHGSDSFSYRLNDGALDSGVATVTLTVTPVNDAPVARDGMATLAEDGSLRLDLAALGAQTGRDVDGDALTALIVAGPAHGTLVRNDDGSYSYVPFADFNGEDAFSYRLSDGSLESNVATVRLTVTAVNDAPVAENRRLDGEEDGRLRIDLLASAHDVDGDALGVVIVAGPQHGRLVLNADGSFDYLPDADFNGRDAFTWRVNDGTADSAVATVELILAAVNDAPVLLPRTLNLDEDGSLLVDLLDGARDVDGDALEAVVTGGPLHGRFERQADGRYRYVPNADFHGQDRVDFRVGDGQASVDSHIVFEVASINDAPVATADAIGLAEDGQARIEVLANDRDVDGDALGVELVDGPVHGTLTLNADGSFSYVAAADYHGADRFSYRVRDGQASSDVAEVAITVTPVNDAPVARDAAFEVDEDGSLRLDLAALGLDVDGDALTVRIVDGPAHGTLERNADGSWQYRPAADFNGADRLRFALSDGTAESNVAAVALTVKPVNDAPVARDLAAVLAEDGSIVIDLGALASDVDGDALSFAVGAAQSGSLVRQADGRYRYSPNADYNGSDAFGYTVGDGKATAGGTVRLTITAVNDVAVALNDSATTKQGQPVRIDVLANDRDADNGAGVPANAGLAARVVTQPLHGTVTVNADGSLTYTPDAGFYGADSFSYVAGDGLADSALASVAITVEASNRPPVALDDAATLQEDGSVRIDLLANDRDPDGDALQLVIVDGPQHGRLTLNADKTVSYVADADYSGLDRFTYLLRDGRAESAVATARLTVEAVADAPSLNLLDQGGGVSRELFRTGWESAADRDSSSTLVQQGSFEGWTLITRPDGSNGGANGFEIWSTDDRMADAGGVQRRVTAAAGNGANWLELNNAARSQHQTLGIERQVATTAGARYTLSLDYAGRIGYSADYTRIGIYVDGVRIASYANTSPSTALNWQALQFAFTGTGGVQTVRIVSEASRLDADGRGAMLDDIALTETLAANTGLEDSSIKLSAIQAALRDADGSETLSVAIGALPIGTVLTDGSKRFTATAGNTRADVTGWNLANLSLTPPKDFNGRFTLDVIATATEQSNGRQASSSAALTVTVLPVADARWRATSATAWPRTAACGSSWPTSAATPTATR